MVAVTATVAVVMEVAAMMVVEDVVIVVAVVIVVEMAVEVAVVMWWEPEAACALEGWGGSIHKCGGTGHTASWHRWRQQPSMDRYFYPAPQRLD